jgi:hypothetical protein
MAICTTCNREMKEAEGCSMNPIPTVDGELTPVLFGSEVDPIQKAYYADGSPRRCDDCGALPANYHHPGCDIEECPRCSGQLLSCDCLIEEPETAEKVVQ